MKDDLITIFCSKEVVVVRVSDCEWSDCECQTPRGGHAVRENIA